MHRQSLGSPSSKLHANIEASGSALKKEDNSHIIASEVDLQNPLKNIIDDNDDEEKSKTQKLIKSHKANNAQKLVVHLIPLLILLCIVILFLFSHDPSQNVIGELNNLEELPAATVVDLKNRGERMVKIGDGEVLGIQSMRNLQAYKKVNAIKYRLHRKIGGFKEASKQD